MEREGEGEGEGETEAHWEKHARESRECIREMGREIYELREVRVREKRKQGESRGRES